MIASKKATSKTTRYSKSKLSSKSNANEKMFKSFKNKKS